MTNRQLNREERATAELMVKRLIPQKETYERKIRICDSKINDEIPQALEDQLRTRKLEREQSQKELDNINYRINLLQDQLKNGVEIKTNKKKNKEDK